jgi:hypothetical protein
MRNEKYWFLRMSRINEDIYAHCLRVAEIQSLYLGGDVLDMLFLHGGNATGID